jgi:hypothetical protein
LIVRRLSLADLGIVALAILLRAAAVLILQSHTVPRATYEHGEIASNLLAGRGFSMQFLGADGPTSQQAPLYPLAVAVAFALGGAETPAALLILELAQSVGGGLLVFGVLILARRVAPDGVWMARAAALLAAVHPTLVYSATHVQSAVVGTTILVWTLASAYKTSKTRRRCDAVVTGVLLALLGLTDPILSLAAVGVAAAIQLGRAGRVTAAGSSFRLTTLVLLVALAAISPWLVRNALAHGEFVPIKSTFGYAFWQGNCAASEGTDKVRRQSTEAILDRSRRARSLAELNRELWVARHDAGYIDDIALDRADREWLGSFSEPERSRILLGRAVVDLLMEPARYGRLCLRRLRYFVLFDETNPKSRVLAYRLPHLALTVLALSGLALARSEVRRRLLPTVLTLLAITAFHVLTIVSARFHIPIEPILALWGGAGLSRWLDRRSVGGSAAPRNHIERVRVVRRLAVKV